MGQSRMSACQLVLYSVFDPPAAKRPRVSISHLFEHLAIGAGSYAALGALAGPDRRWRVGLSGAALVAGWKEGTDAYNGKDSRKMAIFHALTILGGAGIVAAFWH